MPKVVSNHTKNVKLHINLVSCYHKIIVECTRGFEVLSFHILSIWVKYQIVEVKFVYWSLILCKLPILFSTVKLKLR